jgi:carbon-monoxide dehydrogenase medium subunit
MRRGDRRAASIVDVKRIPDLRRFGFDGSTGSGRAGSESAAGLIIGAAVTCAELCEQAEAAARYPGLLDAVGLIGGTAIQGRATVGGNLCNAAPSADTVPALIVANADCVVAGPHGGREVKVSDFCVAPGRTVLASDEILVSFRIPAPGAHSAGAYLRFIPRGEMDIAVAGAAAWLRLEGDTIAEARLALASVAPTPLLVPAAGEFLAGNEPGEESFDEAGRLAAEASRPISDHRGSEAQRRHLARVLTRRCLAVALDRARKGAEE